MYAINPTSDYKQFARYLLSELGYIKLGQGTFATVCIDPNKPDIAIKVGALPDAYIFFLHWGLYHNEFGRNLPEVYSFTYYTTFYVVELERLYPKNPIAVAYSYNKQLEGELTTYAKSFGIGLDFRGDNEMLRFKHNGDRTRPSIVYTDPFYSYGFLSPHLLFSFSYDLAKAFGSRY